MTPATLIVGLIVLAVVLPALRQLRRDRKQGKCACTGDCSRCSGCH